MNLFPNELAKEGVTAPDVTVVPAGARVMDGVITGGFGLELTTASIATPSFLLLPGCPSEG